MMAVSTTNKRKRNLVLAILAGGLVLGVGAAVTLAAWQDDEFANGTFAASGFNLVGQVTTDEGFTDHATSPGGALDFDVSATSLAPGSVTYSPYAVALDVGTTVPATVTVTSPSTTGTVTNLTYALYEVADFSSCTAGGIAAGTALVPTGTAVGTVPGGTTFDLAAGTTTAQGTPQYLCFVVTAGDALEESQAGTAVWQFEATSS
jgi:predicted ribosomally synthesized peptide with SipW-like signal peptide